MPNPEAQVQLKVIRESHLRTQRRRWSQSGDSSKVPTKSLVKSVAPTDPSPNNTPSSQNLEMVAQSAYVPIVNVVKVKSELAGTFASFLEKVEEP